MASQDFLKRSFMHDGDTMRIGKEELLLEGDFMPGIKWGRRWDLHPDGDRFHLLQKTEDPDPPEGIRVVRNWFAELERLVRTGS